ncbi:hypothetical protein PIB30_061823 [Stylosanthes scabra]|uniref:Putative plant transposon protein domain-containing protein n=1 Tax=Stylosanthes scabra TaxID=79078 RepID=A0ABU6ZJQ2_9FABA|nr:hypothetical protein [Stylosanthes scabra]
MWMKLAVCNILPTRHETTLGVDHILLIYALMKGLTISLPGIMVTAMNEDPTKSKKQLLPFPMFITKWAEEAGVPTYQGDKIFNVPKAQQFYPYGLWKEGREADEDPIPPPMLAPAPPLATCTDIPAPSTRSSPQPSRKELIRALRHISQMEQISSPEVSKHQQQAAGDPEDEASSDEGGSDEDSSKE